MAKHRRAGTFRVRILKGGGLAGIRTGALVAAGMLGVSGAIAWSMASSARTADGASQAARSNTPGTSGRSSPGSGRSASSSASRKGALPPGPSPSVRPIAGSSVTAIGDSVMVASTPALEKAIPGIYVNAVEGRQFSTGLQVLGDLKARRLLRPVVVFALGTNGTVTAAEISQLFAVIGPDRRLVLVNTYEARSWEHEVNSMLARAVRDHQHVVLADWHALIGRHTGLLWPDRIHPQPAGGTLYAGMIKAALTRLSAMPG